MTLNPQISRLVTQFDYFISGSSGELARCFNHFNVPKTKTSGVNSFKSKDHIWLLIVYAAIYIHTWSSYARLFISVKLCFRFRFIWMSVGSFAYRFLPRYNTKLSRKLFFYLTSRLSQFIAMSQKGEPFDSNCMTLTRFVLQEQKKFKVFSLFLLNNSSLILIKTFLFFVSMQQVICPSSWTAFKLLLRP